MRRNMEAKAAKASKSRTNVGPSKQKQEMVGKSRTKQKEGAKDGKVEFHLISFAIFKETVRPFEFHS